MPAFNHKATLFQPAIIAGVLSVLLLFAMPQVYAEAWLDEQACLSQPHSEKLQQGWCLAIRRDKGNCIACHAINVTPWPQTLALAGNIAPPLAAMKARFPDQAALQQQIEDASKSNANSVMPPYLKHGILNQPEIALIIGFLHSI